MSGPDDRIRRGLERLVEPGDPSGAFDRVARRRRRYAVRRRAGSALLSIVVVGGAIGGFLGLSGIFRPDPNQVAGADRPGLIAFTARDENGTRQVFVMKDDGTGRRQLTSGPGSHHDPVFSPSGEWIAYRGSHEGERTLIVRHLSDGRQSLVDLENGRSLPRWSPDGNLLAIAGPREVFVLRPAEGSVEELSTGSVTVNGAASWDPWSRRVVFQGLRRPDAPRHDLYALDTTTGRVESLTRGSEDDMNPRWMADGRIVFIRLGLRSPTLTALEPATGRFEEIAPIGGPFTLSPDQRQAAYLKAVPPKTGTISFQLRVLDLIGDRGDRLLVDGLHAPTLEWSPDGSEVLYTAPSGRSLLAPLSVVHVETGTIRHLGVQVESGGVLSWTSGPPRGPDPVPQPSMGSTPQAEVETEVLGGGVYGGFCYGVCDSRVVLSGQAVEILHTERCAPVAPSGVTEDSCDPPVFVNTGRLTAQGDALRARLTSALDAALRPEHDVLQSHGTSRIPTDGADAWIALRRGEVRSTHIFGVFDKPPEHFRIAERFIGGLISASWDCDDTDLVRFGRDCEPVVR